MNILILGGTGVLSADFTKRVLDAGCQTTIVNRGRRRAFLDERAQMICADLREESIDDLREKINNQKYDVVVDFLSYNPEHLKKTLAILNKNFIQYIFISSATAYLKKNEQDVITEKTPLGNTKWEYAYDKFLCEQYLTTLDINYTIIRPYVTYGNSRIPFPIISDGYHYTLIERIKVGKPVALFNNGCAVCTLTHAEDFAAILYRLLLNEKAYKEDYHITGSAVQTWAEAYHELCKILHCKPNSFSVNEKQIKKYLPEFYDILIGDKGTNMIFDNSKVLNAIGGYEFKIDLAKGLKQSVDYFENNIYMQGIDYKWDGRIDYLYRKCVKGKEKLSCISLNNMYSKKKYMYKLMTAAPLRISYDFLWKVKHHFR